MQGNLLVLASIAKQLVELNGGSIVAKYEDNKLNIIVEF